MLNDYSSPAGIALIIASLSIIIFFFCWMIYDIKHIKDEYDEDYCECIDDYDDDFFYHDYISFEEQTSEDDFE